MRGAPTLDVPLDVLRRMGGFRRPRLIDLIDAGIFML